MKIYLLILSCLLISCSEYKKSDPENMMPIKKFKTILKEVHLEQASFEINKNEDLENAKAKLYNSCYDIYKKNNITEQDFIENLNYYSQKPRKLEKIYKTIKEELTQERLKLDEK
tara:strand:+ start:2215 stop:2559 length:345 start_codon:yes stop_codon:yes gene_type:complete